MHRRPDAGFSLVEILISILALSLISGFILELFIISARLNKQVGDRDNADTHLITIIEEFKLQDDPAKFFEGAFFESPEYSHDGDSLSVTQYFDKDWQKIAQEAALESDEYHYIKATVDLSGGSDGLLLYTGFAADGADTGEALISAYCEVSLSAMTFSGGEEKRLGAQTAGKYFTNMPSEAVAAW